MSILKETAIRKRTCHICGGDIKKGEKYIRLSSGYIDIKTKNDNYNTGSNLCRKCILNLEFYWHTEMRGWVI